MVTGSLLSDRYRVEERIAMGGMGSVYLATDERLDRHVALKVLKEELADDERFVERFRREARAAGALSHPNIAGVFDFGQHEARYYMVMELAEGRDLARVLREEGPLSPERSVRIASQIAQALAHAHAAGVVHRDIKPPNVIIGRSDRVKVTDFGIARAVGDSTLTATGSVLGTAHYISPEQAGGGEVGPPADIYALGIVLYEMLTGSLPFTGDSALAVAMRHVSDDVPPPSELNPEVPAHLDSVVARATAKDPRDRFATADEMAQALGAALGSTAEVATAALAGTGMGLAAGEGPAAGATERLEPTVWPIPGGRYDPQRLGRIVLISLGALALIALLLFTLRVPDTGEQRRAATERQEQEKAAPAGAEETQGTEDRQEAAPEGVVISEDLIGSDYREVADALTEAGLQVATESVTSADFGPDVVVETSPPVGTTMTEGDAITLFVNTVSGDEDDAEEDVEEEDGPPEHSKGKGPKKEKDD